jgi:flavodoxin
MFSSCLAEVGLISVRGDTNKGDILAMQSRYFKLFSWAGIAVPATLLVGLMVFGAISEARASEEVEAAAVAEEQEKSLIVFYSKTGNTKAACQIIKKAYDADVVEIKDLVDRFSTWGSITGMIYSLLGWHTDIKPETIDVSPYGRIVIGTPIWGGTFPPAVRTLVETSNLKGKAVAIFSTSTEVINKKYQDEMKATVIASNGDVVGYFQVQAEREVNGEMVKKSIGEIESDTREAAVEMAKAF